MKIPDVVKGWLRAPMFSPAGFVVRAVALLLLYSTLTLAGCRRYMSVLSLTYPEGSSPRWSTFLCLSYLVSYFSVLLGVPILLVAGGLLALVNRLGATLSWKTRRSKVSS